ncbi:MAG: pseudaminic acid synthase [Candidatus Omnitrophica bacterium]|nr:pseudaminic acid synthase [Candidatus Omnitrophota bacterium]
MRKYRRHNRLIGGRSAAFIVAEISANHGQDFKKAVSLVRKAKECGADAVKFQAYTPDTMTLNVNNRYFNIRHPKWPRQTLYQLYQKAYTPWKWFKGLKRIADEEGIVFFSTAFDKSSVDFLEKLKVPFHKIASFELTDLPLIEYAARTKKPIILSSGMATEREIDEAVGQARKGGASEVILLKCVSNYPARPDEMNLRAIPEMRKIFKCPIGLSDHTLNIGTSITAVAYGAVMVEKHFTLSRRFKTPDSFFSLEPHEFKLLAENIRIAEQAKGKARFSSGRAQDKNRIFRRSLFAVKDIKKGELITADNMRSVRPAYGLAPKYFCKVEGKRAKRDIEKGTPLKFSLIEV